MTPSLAELHDTELTRWLKRAYRDLYRQIQRFPWVQDGLSELETDTIDELIYMGAEDVANLRAALGMPWLQDAVSETEHNIIYWLKRVGYEAPQATTAMIPMPFLESPDTGDVLAIHGIYTLAYEDLTESLMDHPTFQEGITDAQTTLVAATGAVRDAEEIGQLLDPGYATVETVSSGTKLTPGLKVSIVRTGTQSRPGTAGAVKDAVEFVERVMGLPLPVDHVILLLIDQAVTSDYPGTNYAFAISYRPAYEQRQGT